MTEKEHLTVGGYVFGSVDDAREAEREIRNLKYLDERVETMSAPQLKAVYNKMLDDKVFKTPVGWEYLKYLKERLISEGVEDEEIRPIPLYVTFTSKSKEHKDYSHIAKMRIIPAGADIAGTRLKLKRSVVANVILIILVIFMFIIALTGSSPNIVNYKTAITNQYAKWEQELTERENAIKEKEAMYENSGG